MNRKEVEIDDVEHGRPEEERAHLIYASCIDHITGDLLILATLDEILAKVKARGWVIVKKGTQSAAR